MRPTIITLVICLFGTAVMADDFANLVEKGNTAFQQGDYSTALDYYHQAEVERPETPELKYNIGSALFNEGKYEEAVENLEQSILTDDIQHEANSYFNLGNTHYKMGDYQKAIDSYQKSLELNPDDVDAKFNLELSRKMLKEQMKPQNQDQQQQQQQQQEQQKQEEQQQQQQQQEEQQQQDQQQEEQQQPQPQEKDENEMTKEDAERILNAVKDDEKDQRKEQKLRGQGDYVGNDW